jgi:syntaxin 8
MSLAKLTALSTQTLSLLLERQRLQSLSPAVTADGTNSSLHLPQITRNLAQLRSGIMELESLGEHTEAVALLRNQHVRMRGMVGSDAVIEPLPEPAATRESTPPREENAWPAVRKQDFTPYTDDPEAGRDPVLLLHEQQRLMDGACHACCWVGTVPLQQTCELQTRTYIWTRFHARLPVSVTYRCKSMASSKYTQAC